MTNELVFLLEVDNTIDRFGELADPCLSPLTRQRADQAPATSDMP